MPQDAIGLKLHDRATRGETLTESERVRLEAWYAERDTQEMVLFNSLPAPNTEAVQRQIETTLGRIQTITHSIQLLQAENERLRQEIATLTRQLAQSTPLVTT